MSGAARGLVVVLTVANVVLVNWHRPLFGPRWRQVMWEGGVLETATALAFLAAAVVFGLAALARPPRSAPRRWLGLFALGCLVLTGEETNYGQGMLLLDLADPRFAERYNPQGGNLHNILPEAWIPIAVFFVGVAVFRVRYHRLQPRLRVPVPPGYLTAVLLTALALPFMRLDQGRYLFVDEVYEWSNAVLFLALAAHARWGWFFGPER